MCGEAVDHRHPRPLPHQRRRDVEGARRDDLVEHKIEPLDLLAEQLPDRAARREADEALARQALKPDARRRIGHVLFAVEQHQLALAQPAMPDRRGRRHFIGDRDVALAFVQFAQQIVVMDRLEIELHILMRAQKARYRDRQRVERERGQRGNAQRSTDAALQIAPRLAQRMDAVLDFGDFGKQAVRILGRHEASAGAQEELEAEQRFGVAQRLGHRRLRNVERARRRADRSVDIDRVENLDVAEIHGSVPRASVSSVAV